MTTVKDEVLLSFNMKVVVYCGGWWGERWGAVMNLGWEDKNLERGGF